MSDTEKEPVFVMREDTSDGMIYIGATDHGKGMNCGYPNLAIPWRQGWMSDREIEANETFASLVLKRLNSASKEDLLTYISSKIG